VNEHSEALETHTRGLLSPVDASPTVGCYRDLGYQNQKGTLPVPENAADEVLSLPIYAELTEPQLLSGHRSVLQGWLLSFD
jgi:dTDP-4-amino-4,6-dideoxygalactose transaminase